VEQERRVLLLILHFESAQKLRVGAEFETDTPVIPGVVRPHQSDTRIRRDTIDPPTRRDELGLFVGKLMNSSFQKLQIVSQQAVRLVALGTSPLIRYQNLRCACLIDGVVEQGRVEIRFTIPRVVEVARVGAINAMVLQNVSRPISKRTWLEILIVIEAADACLADRGFSINSSLQHFAKTRRVLVRRAASLPSDITH
jgi:hypothetical protein